MAAMSRRDVLLATAVTLAVGRVVGRAQETPSIPRALATASARFAAPEADIRTLAVRVSRWKTPEDAAAYGLSLLAAARSDLPAGEFYQTDPVDVAVPADLLAPPAAARAWQTIVGAAGFTTEWLLLVVDRDSLVWDIRISGAKGMALVGPAAALAAAITRREPGDDLATLLPGPDDVPPGMTVDEAGAAGPGQ